MPEPSSSPVTPSKARAAVLGVAALFIASAAGVTFWWAGDLSEEIEPRDADYLWQPWPFLDDHAAVIGVVSVIVFVVAGAVLVVAHRARRLPAPLPAQVIVLTVFAAWLGVAYRVITAGVIGANIGGGGVLLVTPLFGLVAVASVIGLAVRSSRRRDPAS